METSEKKSLSESIIDNLKKAVVELEELRVQAALGKAEAKDVYEEAKKKLHVYLQEAKIKFSEVKNNEDVLTLIHAFEHLQVQLALGKAETKEVFEEQYHKISEALNHLEKNFREEIKNNTHFAQLHLEVEKFKIKLELMVLHYKLNKIKAEYNFEQKKTEFFETLDAIKSRMQKKEADLKHQWDHLSEEISEAYTNLKKTFLH